MAANREKGIADEVLDQLLAGQDPATVFETGGLVDELKKRLAERIAQRRDGPSSGRGGGGRSGQSPQSLWLKDRSDGHGQAGADDPARSPRALRPVLIGKYRRRFAGFDDKIIALYGARDDEAGNRGPYRRALRD